jgi:superfamily II DNA or RNA helicase
MSRRGKRSLPRPYQDKAVREVLTRYTDGSLKMLLHLLTGAGKTIVATLFSSGCCR